jgi:hypothetical protein
MEVRTMSLIMLSCLLVASCGASVDAATEHVAKASAAMTSSAEDAELSDDCGDKALLQKEACYATKPQAMIEECERMRVNRCAPYAQLHKLEAELQRLDAQLSQLARKRYATYEADQPGYVVELELTLASSAASWRALRDAHCSAEPLIQGMSLSEVPDLSEACRAEMTERRIKEVTTSVSILMDETHDERATN